MEIETFGSMVRSLRMEKKLKQSELGQKIGCSQQAIARWENQDGIPSRRNILLLANALEVSAEIFLEIPGLSEKDKLDIMTAAKQQEREKVFNMGYDAGEKIADKMTSYFKRKYFTETLPLYNQYKMLIESAENILDKIQDEESKKELEQQLQDLYEKEHEQICKMLEIELQFFSPSAYFDIQDFFDEMLSNPENTTDEYKQLLAESQGKQADDT